MNYRQIQQTKKRKRVKIDHEYQIIIFPQKFLNPLPTYRLRGDVNLHCDCKYLIFNDRLHIGLSGSSAFKKVSKINVTESKIILHLTQLDFIITPWQYVVQRLQSLGDQSAYDVCQFLMKYWDYLGKQAKDDVKTELHQIVKQQNYKSSKLCIYTYFKELQQYVITEIQLDLRFLEDFGITQKEYIQCCLKYGIPEFSLKYNGNNSDLFDSFIEFGKHLIDPNQESDFYLYSKRYPNGLKTDVQFKYEQYPSEDGEFPKIYFYTYYNYYPTQVPILDVDYKLKQKNFLSVYYNVSENLYSRCRIKKVKI